MINERSREAGQERRHHPITFVVNGQRITGMDRAFVGQATIFVSFRTTSHKELRALKDCCGALDAVPDERFTTLKHGECIIAALQTTGEREVYHIKTRPSVSHAGGETLRVSGGE